MQIPFFQIDAFADKPFSGNPAAVCPLKDWLEDDVLQAIAEENNLSETAFLVGGAGRYDLRWFTPVCEVDLCGHATLASAHVVFWHLEPDAAVVTFATRSGNLVVRRDGDTLSMTFPALPARPAMVPDGMSRALGTPVMEFRQATDDWMAVVKDAETVAGLKPDFHAIAGWPCRGIIVTAKGGEGEDFVSRFFGPRVGIDEDPVTGSAHCVLAPYWAKRLKKTDMVARQVSKRGGTVSCRVADDDTVILSGCAVLVLEGTLYL